MRARQSAKQVLLLHDTTTMGYGIHTQRSGMGKIAGGGMGFMAHFSLAVEEGTRKPLGLLGCTTFVRPEDVAEAEAESAASVETGDDGGKTPHTHSTDGAAESAVTVPERYARKRPKSDKSRKAKRQDDPDNEGLRWAKQALEIARGLGSVKVIHVMDREADCFALAATLVAAGEFFVIRVKDDRVLADGNRLFANLAGMGLKLFRTIRLNARAPAPGAKQNKTNPPREEREAELEIAGGDATIARPSHAPRNLPKSLNLNYVYVREPNPPPGCEPVVWRLMTNLPVATQEQMTRVVDIYRARWTIEDFNKALKTGCAFLRHQLESYGAICKLLALLLPVAWMMLKLRHAADHDPEAPATEVLSPGQLHILRGLHDKDFPKSPMPKKPSVQDAMWAVARLGGHFRKNGKPGWLTLGRGMHRLLEAELTLEALGIRIGSKQIGAG